MIRIKVGMKMIRKNLGLIPALILPSIRVIRVPLD